MSQQTPHDDPFSSIPIAESQEPVETIVDQKITEPSEPEKPSFSRKDSHPKNSASFLLKTALIILLICITVFLAGGFLLIPYAIKTFGADSLAKQIDRPVTFGQVSFNPFTNKLEIINGIVGPRLSDPDDTIDPIISFNKMELDLEVSSVWHQALICKQLKFKQLFVHLVRSADGTYNLQNAFNLSNLDSNAIKDASFLTKISGLPLSNYSLNNIALSDSELLFTDLGTGTKHTINDLSLALPLYANIPYTLKPESIASFSALINGSRINLAGSAKDEATSQTSLNFKMEDLEVAQYLQYLPQKDRVFIKKGRADLDLHLNIASQTDQQLQVSGSIQLRDLEVEEENGRTSLFPAATINGSFSPLSASYHIKEALLNRPHLTIERSTDGNWQLPGFIEDLIFSTSKLTNEDRFDQLQISSGKLEFIDKSVQETFKVLFHDFNVSISLPPPRSDKHASSDNTEKAQFAISANMNKTLFNVQGNLDLSSQTADGLIISSQVELNKFSPYFSQNSSLTMKKGVADKLSSKFLIDFHKNKQTIQLHELDLELSNIALSHSKETILTSRKLSCKKGSFNSKDSSLNLGHIVAEGSHAYSVRQKNKDKWVSVLPSNSKNRKRSKSSKPVTCRFNTVSIKNSKWTIIDYNWPKTFKLSFSNFNLQTTEASSSSKQTFAATAQLGKTPIAANGTFSSKPFSAQFQAEVNKLPLKVLKPIADQYFNASLQGFMTAKGKIQLPGLVFQGDLALSEVNLAKQKSLITWSNAISSKVNLAAKPFALKIDELNLQSPFLSLAVDKQGKLALATIFKKDWTPAEDITSSRMVIGKTTITNGMVSYKSPNSKPSFSMQLKNLKGHLTGYQLAKESQFDLFLEGKAFKEADIVLAGSGKLYSAKSTFNLSIEQSPIALSLIAPNLEPYIAHKIKGGTVRLQSDFILGNNQLNSESNLQFKATSLGQELKPNQILAQGDSWKKLPLFIALNENEKGLFSLSIPSAYSGSHDSDKFWNNVRKNFRKLLLKATVSPFSIPTKDKDIPPLSDQLSFTGGNAEISAKSEELLTSLATMLKKRPRLKLAINGYADAKLDRQALIDKKKSERRKLQLQREAMISQAASATYGKEVIQQPQIRSTPVQSQAPLRKITISDKTLIRLAQERSQQCKNSLIAMGVPQKQLSIVGGGKIINPSKLGRTGSRVIFTLENL